MMFPSPLLVESYSRAAGLLGIEWPPDEGAHFTRLVQAQLDRTYNRVARRRPKETRAPLFVGKQDVGGVRIQQGKKASWICDPRVLLPMLRRLPAAVQCPSGQLIVALKDGRGGSLEQKLAEVHAALDAAMAEG